MHLVWLRCSSVEYWEYSPSSRLPSRAPQVSKLADLFLPGPLLRTLQISFDNDHLRVSIRFRDASRSARPALLTLSATALSACGHQPYPFGAPGSTDARCQSVTSALSTCSSKMARLRVSISPVSLASQSVSTAGPRKGIPPANK